MKWLLDLFKTTTPIFVEIRGRETLLAEGYCRIELYSPERIVLANEKYSISVCGGELDLRHLSESAIAIDGRIDKVEFL
ncbi:MAG: YabP/YqfC family sporulation protein [Clostridia bacterium]|nr:YabP/YqfC family sporulation protein [Clostridia bacterium]